MRVLAHVMQTPQKRRQGRRLRTRLTDDGRGPAIRRSGDPSFTHAHMTFCTRVLQTDMELEF